MIHLYKMDTEWIVRQHNLAKQEWESIKSRHEYTVSRLKRYLLLPDRRTLLEVEDTIQANILETLRKLPDTPGDQEYPPMTITIVKHEGAWYKPQFPTEGLLSGPEWTELTKASPPRFSRKFWEWIGEEIKSMIADVWAGWIRNVLPDTTDIRVSWVAGQVPSGGCELSYSIEATISCPKRIVNVPQLYQPLNTGTAPTEP